MYIRSAEKDEECKYVLIGNDGQVLKKYYEHDEPVNFKKEVVVYEKTYEIEALKQAVLELQEKLKLQDEGWEPQYDVQKIQVKG
jgi:hypothetical protein